MDATKTFIFLDLETTGLPTDCPTRVTEIALVAVSREHIIDKDNGGSKENDDDEKHLPRVINKMNLTLYPCKMINPMASVVSGLTNKNLEQQGPFNENVFEMMNLFMERLEKPVCLVAHNGNRFDFPILQSELSRIKKAFSDDVFCVDSLPAFRGVLSEPIQGNSTDTLSVDVKPLTENRAVTLLPKCGWSNEEYDLEMVKATELAEKFSVDHTSFDVEEIEVKIQLELDRLRKINEHTPIRKHKMPLTEHKEVSVRRRLLCENKPKMQYNLKSLYENLTGRSLANAHRAEVDALALLECVAAVGTPILEWMDSNRMSFRSIKKMW